MFRVFLRGDNVLTTLDGVTSRFGFYVTRFVDATNDADAKDRTARAVWEEVFEKGVVLILNERNDAPEGVVEEVEEIEPTEKPARDPGFVWFRIEQ